MSRSNSLDPRLADLALRTTRASAIVDSEIVQELWSGYGHIVRCKLDGAGMPTVIVKHVRWPQESDHPRGWNSNRSHERKVQSYRVETVWYERHAARCGPGCRVPRALAVQRHGEEVFMVLEDLDAAGYPGRRREASPRELEACLSWLAHFHATFMGAKPDGLWPIGTYWHLATRPDELEALEDGPLKQAAATLDHKLNEARFRTFVHGDAKIANFCFSGGGDAVAAVDFQYVGGGCGMKDVAYFLGSCLDEERCERLESTLLAFYFQQLKTALEQAGARVEFDALEEEWSSLYPVAWTDFHRFLQGWSPGHWKLHRYSERLAREVLESL